MYGAEAELPKATHYLDRFIEKKFPDASKTEFIAGCVPIAICPKNLHNANVLVLGDAARQANPLSAGGIMNALEASDLAVEELLANGKNGAPAIQYSARWRKNRFEQKCFYLLKEIILNSSDRNLSAVMEKLEHAARRHLDRSHPFKITLSDVSFLVFSFLPQVVRFRHVLAK